MEHAHWIPDEYWRVLYTCSNCGWYFATTMDIEEECNYCPHCGAKMDEEEDNEKQSTAESKEK